MQTIVDLSWFNASRRHSTLNYLTPNAYEASASNRTGLKAVA